MDGSRFDSITRTWHTGSRRRLLGSLAVAALTPLLPRRAGANCQDGTSIQHPCGTQECVDGEFVNVFEGPFFACRPAESECDIAEFCSGTSFACPPDETKPNGTGCSDDGNPCTANSCHNGLCVAEAIAGPCDDDGNSCTNNACLNGICMHPAKPDGTPCPTGVCRGGQCVAPGDKPQSEACDPACEAGTTCCGGHCVNLQQSKRNCGTCGKQCRRGKRCRGGRCR